MAHRFYAEQEEGEEYLLSPDDARHALRVLRLHRGDEVELIAGGRRFRASVGDSMPDGRLRIRAFGVLPSTEPTLRLTLFQGLPKADKMEWIIQKAVELGVSRIVPVRMSRCVVRLEERDLPRKLERWRRIAREAGKQSGRCLIPEIAEPTDPEDLPAQAASLDECVVPWEEYDGTGPRAFAAAHPMLTSLGIVIGPEGGISREEMDLLCPPCKSITLGRRILRTETAGLAAASAFLALYGEMESD